MGGAPDDGPELGRTLATRHVTLISLGGVIGAGLFVGSSTAISVVGPAVVLSYLAASVILLLVMRMLGEMALARPGMRTFTELVRDGLGPAAGFLVGWMYWYLWVVAIAVEAIAGAGLLKGWIGLPIWQTGLVLLGLMTTINLMSTRAFGEFEFWFASVKVAAIALFIVLAAGHVSGISGGDAPKWHHLVEHGGFLPRGGWVVVAGVTTVFFSLAGAEIATIAAAESCEPAVAVARIVRSLVLRTFVFYAGSVLLIVSVVPWRAVVPGISPFTTALAAMGFSWARSVVDAVILSAVLSSLNAGFYVSSRVLFTLASRRDAPRWLVTLNRRRVPARAVLFGSLVASVAVAAAAFAPTSIFSFLVNASGALILFVYLMVCLAYLRDRRRQALQGATVAAVRLACPLGAYVAIAGILGVLLVMAVTPGLVSQFYASLVPIVVIAASYIVVARMRG